MIRSYRRAGYPVVAIETSEERRLVQQIVDEAEPADLTILTVGATGGIINARTGAKTDPAGTFRTAIEMATAKDVIVVVFDWHHVGSNPAAYRPLLSAIPEIKATGSTIVLVAPRWSLAPELEHDIPVVTHSLPSRDQLRPAVAGVVDAINAGRSDETKVVLSEDDITSLCDAASGLAYEEAESAIALSIAETGELDPVVVEREKLRLVQQTKGLSVLPRAAATDLGGLESLKSWISDVVLPARHDPQLRAKAALFIGPPGTGKSLASIVIGAMMRLPVVGLDLMSCRGSYVGQTEGAVKAALQRIDAIAPCVLRIDELDSALGGHKSSSETDGGVTLGVLSMLLTWSQERTSEVLVLATANYPERIPPALLRPGRLDAIWSIDLPTVPERQEIAEIHLRKLGCSTETAVAIASETEGFSGAEIAAVVLDAARRTGRAVTEDAARVSCSEIVPLSRSRAAELASMREWAHTYARSASATNGATATGHSRKVRVG